MTGHFLLELKKQLRTAKTSAHVPLRIHPVTMAGFVSWTDAARAARRDGTSSGGYLLGAVTHASLDGQQRCVPTMVWCSQKLRRVAREAKASSVATGNTLFGSYVCADTDAIIFPSS